MPLTPLLTLQQFRYAYNLFNMKIIKLIYFKNIYKYSTKKNMYKYIKIKFPLHNKIH